MRTLVPSFLGHHTLATALPGFNDLSPSLSMTLETMLLKKPCLSSRCLSIDSWEKFKNYIYIKKKHEYTSSWSTLARFRVASNERMRQKTSFRDRIIYYWTHKEPSTGYSSGCPPTLACFVWTFSQVSKFWVEISPERMEYPWFLLVSLVRPGQSLDVSGVW